MKNKLVNSNVKPLTQADLEQLAITHAGAIQILNDFDRLDDSECRQLLRFLLERQHKNSPMSWN